MALTPSSQVVLRNAAQLTGKVLLVRPPEDGLTQELQCAQLDALPLDLSAIGSLRVNNVVGVQNITEHYDHAIIFLPREKPLLAMLTRLMAAHCDKIWVVGPKDHGIQGAKKVIEALGPVRQLDLARHCRLYEVAPEASSATLAEFEQQFSIEVADVSLELCSLPGVFSHGQLDGGTRLLLENLPTLGGDVLDFGSGCGVIGSFIGKRHDVTVSAIDTNILAVLATRKTLALNNVSGEVVQADTPTVFTARGKRFGAIVSNPPFHAGKKDIDFSAVRELISQAPKCLTPGGRLIIVANAFLPYHDLLEQYFRQVEIIADDRKFRVYVCRQAKK